MTIKISLSTETINVPLDSLSLDPLNPRQTHPAGSVEELADRIAANGLLQNLGVRPDEREGRFLVSFGGRRFAALKHLVKTKRLAKNAPVPCRLGTAEDATVSGLDENMSRLAMHPADMFAAFSALIEQGLSVDAVALRFGITEQTVHRRMRLGRLSPVVLDAFREGRISEEAAKAFSIVSDHAAQERVLSDIESRAAFPGAHTIRNMLTQGDVPVHDPRSRFVSLQAYEAAGGLVRRDLFANHDGSATLADPELLNRLTLDGLEQVAVRVRAEGWADVTVRLEGPDRMELIGWTRAEPSDCRDLAPADAERFAAITARMGELEALDELTDDEDEELACLEAEQGKIKDRSEWYDAATVERGRAVIYLGLYGEPGIARLVPVAESESQALASANTATNRPAKANPQEAAGKGLTAALTASLLAHRTVALQAHVALRPGLALRLLAQALMLDRAHCAYAAPLRIRLSRPETLPFDAAQETKDGPARKVLDEAHERRGDHQPGAPDGLLPWLLAMEDSQVIDLIAPLLAESIDAGSTDWTARTNGLAAQAARAADYDPSPYWTATTESYFGRVSKEQIAEAVRETGECVNLGAKKAEVATEATRRVSGTGWVPTLLRAPPAANDDGDRLAAD